MTKAKIGKSLQRRLQYYTRTCINIAYAECRSTVHFVIGCYIINSE